MNSDSKTVLGQSSVAAEVAAKEKLPYQILKRIQFTDECWHWQGPKNRYGCVILSGQHTQAHRVIYEVLVGAIPEGLVLDHLCRNILCVNPGHLEPVTHRENILRGVGPAAQNARKTHCKRGHELSGSNLIFQNRTNRPNPTRACHICMCALYTRRNRRRRAKAEAVLAEVARHD